MTRRLAGPVFAVLIGLALVAPAHAQFLDFPNLKRVNQRLSGTVIDHTDNHGVDRRIYSPILGMPRDLYVYLPPGYDPHRAYPLVILLHMANQDERFFVHKTMVKLLDDLITCGQVPPVIFASPDGILGEARLFRKDHSLFINGPNGRFEDHILQEVVPFLMTSYSIRPERQAHGLLGISAGGYGAMGIALEHRDYFGAVAILAGALNLRYFNVEEIYKLDFDPATYRWKTRYDPREVVGVYYHGLLRFRARRFMDPAFGTGDIVPLLAETNPADKLFTTGVQPGELAIYASYGGRDNFNFDAQTESFAWLAATRGIHVTLDRDPNGKHTFGYLQENAPRALYWLGQHLLPPTP